MKKTISLVLVAILLVAMMAPTAFAAEHPSTVTVTYTASGSAFSAFIGDLTYDHDLFTLVSVSGVNCSSAENNGDRVIWERGTNVEAPITVLTAVFNVKAGIDCGTYTGFGVAVAEALDENLAAVSLSISGNNVVLDHDWVAGTTVDATCTVDGYTPYTCSICGDTKQDIITAPGHTPADAVEENVVGATCTVAGSYDSVVYCSVCGEKLSSTTVTGQTLPHDYADATCTAPKTCKDCGATEGNELGHKWTDATCTTAKTCSVCGATDGAALGHDWADATCTDPKTCSVCGATEGAALGHKFVAKPNDGKHTHDWICSVCQAVGVTGEACSDADKDGYCDHCDQEMKKEDPKPTDPEGGNKTGDITPYPAFVLMAVAAVMGTAYGFKRKFVK